MSLVRLVSSSRNQSNEAPTLTKTAQSGGFITSGKPYEQTRPCQKCCKCWTLISAIDCVLWTVEPLVRISNLKGRFEHKMRGALVRRVDKISVGCLVGIDDGKRDVNTRFTYGKSSARCP